MMPTDREKMLRGELYLASDPELVVVAAGNPCRILRPIDDARREPEAGGA